MSTTQTAPFSLRSIAVPAFEPARLFSIGEGAILPGRNLSEAVVAMVRARGPSTQTSLIYGLLGGARTAAMSVLRASWTRSRGPRVAVDRE